MCTAADVQQLIVSAEASVESHADVLESAGRSGTVSAGERRCKKLCTIQQDRHQGNRCV
jgi:hypothetical protein